MPLILVPLLLCLDQAVKIWAVAHLAPGVPHPFLPLLNLTLIYNTGAAFGLFPGGARILVVVSVVVGFGILYYLSRHKLPLLQQVAFSLIAAGALGNAIDRIGRGSVVDYLDTTGTGWGPFDNFPIFNLADACVVVGVILLLLPIRRRKW